MKEQQIQIQPHVIQGQKQLSDKPLIPQINKSTSRNTKINSLKYRNKLKVQLFIIFIICLFYILERVFYQIIVNAQNNTLASFQLTTKLVVKGQFQGEVYPADITDGFLKFYGGLSEFPVLYLLVTHVLATIYVSVDALLATKVLYVTMFSIYLVSVIQMLYAGAHPFWTDHRILSSYCLQGFNHPSMGMILMTFIPCYFYYVWTRRNNLRIKMKIPMKDIAMGIGLVVVVIVVQFVNYMVGIVYLINICTSLVITAMLLLLAIASNTVIESLIKKSTILKTKAKGTTFSWLFFICLMEALVVVILSGQDPFLEINWVNNWINCINYQEGRNVNYKYDQVIGFWFNFVQTSTVFGWIGAIFGISEGFRRMPIIEWSKGKMKYRVLRGVVTNILIIPSWFFILLIEPRGSWIRDIGLNSYIVNGLHAFFLYLWIFGYMPILLLNKLFNWVNREEQNLFIPVNKNQVSQE